MARRCALTEKGAQTGHKVSHSNRKAKRSFNVNLKTVTLHSDALGQAFQLRIAVSTLRSVDHNGGLDGFLLGTSNLKLSAKAVTIKKKILKKQAEQKAA